MMNFSDKQKEELENNDELFKAIEKATNYEEAVKERVGLYKLQERLDKKYSTTLGKIDSVLEYIQTSSSDLTLPGGVSPRKEAAKTQIEIEKEVKDIADVLNQSYEMIDTLASANPWCDEVEDKINDVVNQIVEAKKKIKGV